MTLPRRCFGLVVAVASASLLLAASGEKVKQVDSKYVCMINKKHFRSEQVQVNIEGRAYYACCESCKTQLLEDPSARADTDPVSGNRIDKASAVVGADKAGNVYFFENLENLQRFRVPAPSQK